ncbi:MAG: PAS domain S-box protein [Desulfuromonadaceae bacterium]|nr:PAS domain S-box protein [Desulfuromonadaceae bacterium]MDD5106000.1 PAS domain S-box protein [Desulfuromonadaceae bacterium]
MKSKLSKHITRAELIRELQALQLIENEYRLLLDESSDPIFAFYPDGRYRYVNQEFANGVGCERSDIIGRKIWDVFSREEADRRFALVKWVFENGQTRIIEVRVPRPDGDRFYVTTVKPILGADGAVTSVICISKDITERKKGEKALQEGKDLLAEIIELSPISMAIVNMDGTIEQINRRAIETFGYYPDDIPNMECWWEQAYPDEAYRAEVFAQWMGLVGKAIAEKSEIERSEYRITCKDGTVKTTLIFGIPVSDKVFVIFDDITERKRAEEERLQLEQQFLQAQKLESLGIMAGGIAHDFNNLLQSILGNLELAALTLPRNTDQHNYITNALNSGEAAAHLTGLMLAYVGKGLLTKKDLDLNELVRVNTDMLKTTVGSAISLELCLSQDAPKILADKAQIQQVIMNLLTNAAESIEVQPGFVRLSTGIQNCDQACLAASLLDKKPEPGRFVFLEISDTGCGMSAETMKRLFDPFFTTKFTGRGLGMSAVMGIMKTHNGALFVQSAPGKGTTFKTLFPAPETALPIMIPQERTPPAENITAAEKPLSGVALVVDDEKNVLRTCKKMVELCGFTVIAASDGIESVSRFREHAEEIDVVLLDLTMPNMDGIAAMNAIYSIRPDVKLILSSGFNKDELGDRFTGQAPSGFIRKPYSMTVLETELRRVMLAE